MARSNEHHCYTNASRQIVRFLGAGILLALTACHDTSDAIKKIAVADYSVLETGREIEMIYTSRGQTKVKIFANELVTKRMDNQQQTEFLNDLKLFFYDENQTLSSKMSAQYGIYYPDREEVFVRDNVVIVNTKGEMLNTEELTWKRKEKKIYSDKFVRITTPQEIIYGTGFTANQDFSDYRINNITGVIQYTEESPGNTP
ncbi:MAG: hypothetical protein KatS3mg031_1457 [Chitinophagales bacterium]|nr:MAG: hypothetical protein KatS3mg031_1457 [Chitinophagales bacterium]